MGNKTADVGLIIEGNYPYMSGGISSWIHDIIKTQSHLSFHIVAILAPGSNTTPRYQIPENVLSISNLFLQVLPPGSPHLSREAAFFSSLERILVRFFQSGTLADLKDLIALLSPYRSRLGYRFLLESEETWAMLLRMYEKTFPGGSFVDFFWSWRSIFGGLFSILLHPLPPAKMYHSLCTGFAGIYGARASLESGKPLLLTEHGIYTNERRIELGAAQWIHDLGESDLHIDPTNAELRKLWINTFASYSKICYEASNRIISLFKENREVQEVEGANPKRLDVIPNGVHYDRFSTKQSSVETPQPTIALIGRVVPIKGIKTFLIACQMIKDEIPNLRALVLGTLDEDPAYFSECVELIKHLDLTDTVEFLGEVHLDDYLSSIDVLVLTSVSEAQPLVVLEAGAAGIPAVVTNVGSCRDLIYGSADENPSLGAGGAVVPVSDARGVAHEVIVLLKDPALRKQCGRILQTRVKKYYNSQAQHHAYRELYEKMSSRSGAVWQG